MIRWLVPATVMSCLSVGVAAAADAVGIIDGDTAIRLGGVFAALVILLLLLARREASRLLGRVDQIPDKEWFDDVKEFIDETRRDNVARAVADGVLRNQVYWLLKKNKWEGE